MGAADYRFTEAGEFTISVVLLDGGGASATDDMTVTVVDSPPEAFIEQPAPGSTFSPGATVRLSGYALDANWGDGPGPEELPCLWLRWESSDPTDDFSDRSCVGLVTLGDPGPRTLTMTLDRLDYFATAEVTINVEACGFNCPPDVFFRVLTPSVLDGSVYDPPFSGDGYFLTSEIEMWSNVDDADVPSDTPIHLEWWATAPCFGPDPCPSYLIERGVVGVVPASTQVLWTPATSGIPEWSNCALVALPFTITLRATDARGESREYDRVVHLACELI